MRLFWAGFLFHFGLNNLWMDFIGKERYIQEVQEKWISGNITVPIEIACLFYAFYVVRKEFHSGHRAGGE